VRANPYLSAGSAFWHSDVKSRITFAIESDWSSAVKTQLSARHERVDMYALPADPFGTGIWQFAYAGTTFLKFQAEGFAKLTPNDYVSATAAVNSTKNSISQGAVPYLPEFELGGSYSRAFPFGVALRSRLSYHHQRETDILLSQKLPGFFLLGVRADYELWSSLRVFLDLHNITDKKYEFWKGYQASPFMLTAGVSVRW
ncbi:MAG: hypothetical protein ACRDGA_13220, partial [Bacteroidota bacterium]